LAHLRHQPTRTKHAHAPVVLYAKLLHHLDVGGPAVVHVGRDVARGVVRDAAWRSSTTAGQQHTHAHSAVSGSPGGVCRQQVVAAAVGLGHAERWCVCVGVGWGRGGTQLPRRRLCYRCRRTQRARMPRSTRHRWHQRNTRTCRLCQRVPD
jgi:hypothetical protein